MIVWMFSAMILRNAYQGSLFDHLHSQVQSRSMDTLAKITQFNYTLYVTPIIYNILKKTNPNLRLAFTFIFSVNAVAQATEIICFKNLLLDWNSTMEI